MAISPIRFSDTAAWSLSGDDAPVVGACFADVLAPADDDITGRKTLPFILAKQSLMPIISEKEP